MSRFDEALEKFGKALGELKESYADEYGVNPNYLSVSIDDGNTYNYYAYIKYWKLY